jgi:hypothetical protein
LQLAALGDRVASESVPGVPRALILALKPLIDAGVEPQRIAAALQALQPAAARTAAATEAASALPKPNQGEECEVPEVKKFLVRTSISGEQPGMSVGFGAGALTLSAQGTPARNAERKAEAWFEPAEPVTVRFAQAGGKATETSGKLPIQYAVEIGSTRYRFLLAAGSRGFIQVTGDRCKTR